MRIVVTELRFGPGYIQQPGTEIDLPEADAVALVKSNRARLVENPAPSSVVKSSDNKKRNRARG